MSRGTQYAVIAMGTMWCYVWAVGQAVTARAQEGETSYQAQLFPVADIDVPAREAGVIEEIKFEPGETIQKGDLIARLDSDLADAELEVALLGHQIAIIKASSDVDQRLAQKTIEVNDSQLRMSHYANELFTNTVSRTELEKLQLELEKSRLSLEQAQRDHDEAELTAQLKEREANLAQVRVARRRITAPFTGIVVKRHHENAEWVNPGDPVVRLIRLDVVRAEIYVNAAFARSLTPQQQVVFRPSDARNEPIELTGKIVFIDPEVQPVRNLVRVWAELDNRELRVKPGEVGTLHFDAIPESR
ncbi:MAG: HlyD family efflux transporter periplasmic adaptor subunit [Planctomycetales bacterium]|nr:HlyD family efflux transporter periplasmic adaptor subunit [Planctomycetales bacterium]